MVSFPPCKINLGLRVIRKRDDGFHDIDTCFYPVPFTDILEVIPSREFGFTTSGLEIPGMREDNLCLKAYQLMKDEFDIPFVNIHLHKIIPAGAGLGGGSSDAAHTLRLLNDAFHLKIAREKLFSLAARLGSDCSFFIEDKPMNGSGRGEILRRSRVDLKGKFLMLVNPGFHISTSEAYAGITPVIPEWQLDEILSRPVQEWKSFLVNDFENFIFRKFPDLGALKHKLYDMGALFASMTGSGSSVFGIFDKEISSVNPLIQSCLLWKGYL
jgi:4-diphosphocytidyl-2-C-methyl-D-erythritol kinase